MPEGEGGEARGRLSCSRVISLWWLKDPMVLSHSCSETVLELFGIAKNLSLKIRSSRSTRRRLEAKKIAALGELHCSPSATASSSTITAISSPSFISWPPHYEEQEHQSSCGCPNAKVLVES